MDKHFEKLEKVLYDKINGVGRLSNNFLLVKYYDNKGLTREMADSIKIFIFTMNLMLPGFRKHMNHF